MCHASVLNIHSPKLPHGIHSLLPFNQMWVRPNSHDVFLRPCFLLFPWEREKNSCNKAGAGAMCSRHILSNIGRKHITLFWCVPRASHADQPIFKLTTYYH